jgi:hypothetical protein
MTHNMEELKTFFMHYTREEFNNYIGNCKLRKAAKITSSWDAAVLTVQAELRSWVADMTEAASLLMRCDSPAIRPVTSFLPTALDMKGVIWDPATSSIREQSIRDWATKHGSHNYLMTTLIMIGKAGSGKSEFAMCLAHDLATRHSHTKFGYCKNLDALGRLTLAGHMDKVGCFVMADFELVSKLEKRPLSEEDVKALLDPKESGGFDCRYSPAIFCRRTPRIWTLNDGRTANGRNYEEWFQSSHNVSGLTALSKRNLAELQQQSEHQLAIARRAFIVHVPDMLFEVAAEDAEGEVDDDEVYFREGMKQCGLV